MSAGKLVYFPVRARAEPIRILLHAAGVQFDDERITFDQWATMKETIKGNQLPIFHDSEGKIRRQSMAILRSFALKYGFYTTDADELYRIEMPIGLLDDLFMAVARSLHIKDEAEKKKTVDNIAENQGPLLLNQVQEVLDESKSGFLADTPKPSLADILLVSVLDHLEGKQDKLLSQFPKLQDHKEKIVKHFPSVAEYMKTRPATRF